ncbi:MAG: GTPase Era [Gammaproteobacteria bacterium RIFCSPHIGHO2_12_FULL_37_14]|nr:MAG: GTPase Era [Gammaproteobacteria bacterium RIFCSPHIGHO2_12_FULL_37_14]
MKVERSGIVAILGRPNVGKSTLLNCLLGKKLSITSAKPQTTRWQILGIKTLHHAQIIYIDTPGLHEVEKHAMNRYMNRIASSVLLDADIIIFMINAMGWQDEDELVLKKLKNITKPVILVINKIDLLKDKTQLLPMIDQLQKRYPFVHVIPISALKADKVTSLENEIIHLLPAGPQLYPEDQLTDKSVRFQIAEIIREKIIQALEEELPYVTTVEIEQFKQESKLTEISAIIWVERQGQKIIIIGKQGAQLKKIGTQARRDIEKLLGQKIFLRLWVKVKERWTDDERALKSLGYE